MEPTNSVDGGVVGALPNYTDILRQIRDQISKRAGTIAYRVLLISWPALIYIGIIKFFSSNGHTISDFQLQLVFAVTPFVLLYVAILAHMFSIEKNIWIDSFFDNKNLDPKESMRIARKIFWPSLAFRLQIFVRYYLAPFLVLLVPFGYFFHIFFSMLSDGLSATSASSITSGNILFLVCSAVLIPLFVWIYSYYIKIRLRYIWFIYLDNFGKPDFSFAESLKQMDALDEVCKSESFKRSLEVHLSADVVENLMTFSIHQMFRSLQSGNETGVAVSVLDAYGAEFTDQLASYSKIVGNYVLYRFACSVLYGQAQEVNENIYQI